MIDIVGHIKVDESKPERIKYLLACIRSYRFLVDHCNFILSLIGASDRLEDLVCNELDYFGDNCKLVSRPSCLSSYGEEYIDLLRWCNGCHIVNFMEDHFMVINDLYLMQNLLREMQVNHADVLKASFFKVEQNSIGRIPEPDCIRDGSIYGRSFLNSKSFHDIYQRYYKSRYYIGCNFITTRDFAIKFWKRNLSCRPHGYEVVKHEKQWEHIVMFPGFEIQASVDDDHGEPNTCLLKRNDCEKWNKIWKEINDTVI